MQASQAARAALAIRPCYVGMVAAKSTQSFARRGVLASPAVLSHVWRPTEATAATQVRHSSNKEANAPWIKRMFLQNDTTYVKPKTIFPKTSPPTDSDLPLLWNAILFICILLFVRRICSYLTGGDIPTKNPWGPRPPPEKLD